VWRKRLAAAEEKTDEVNEQMVAFWGFFFDHYDKFGTFCVN